MTVPTPPAVSDAMREAVAREIAPRAWEAADEMKDWPDSLYRQAHMRHREPSLEVADRILAGPIASEIARLTGERNAAVANAREPIGDTWDEIRRLEGECRVFIRERDEWKAVADRDLARAEAAEAETARLRAALEPYRSGGSWGGWLAWLIAGAPDREKGKTAAKQIVHWQTAVDAALSSQEKTDA